MTMNSCAFCGEPVEFGCVCDKCQPKHKRTSLWKKLWRLIMRKSIVPMTPRAFVEEARKRGADHE